MNIAPPWVRADNSVGA
ncbi:hypothetical protein AKJ16_DCAP09872 [Drosera capensis]